MNVIRSHKHEIYTETVNKIALSYEDDNIIILSDGIHTHACGYKLKKNLYIFEKKNLKIFLKKEFINFRKRIQNLKNNNF